MKPGFLGALQETVSVPLVLVGYCAGGKGVGCVANDGFAGAREIVKYLYGLGHRRIGFVGDRGMLQAVRTRFDGYKAALAEPNLAVQNEFIALADSASPDRCSIEVMLSGAPRPDAVVAATEDLVPEVLDVASRLGLGVPDQVNVVGIWDTAEVAATGECRPRVVVAWEEIGREAVRMVTDAIEKGRRLNTLLIPPELTWGGAAEQSGAKR